MSGIETPGLPALSVLTGLERFAADTGLVSGVAPQTAAVTSAQLGAGGTSISVQVTAFSFTVPAGITNVLFTPAGTLATGTVVFPATASVADGQNLRISSTQTITALTLTAGSGQTINNSPTALTVSTTAPYGYEFIFNVAALTWFRLQ